jgi:hypothetical protein
MTNPLHIKVKRTDNTKTRRRVKTGHLPNSRDPQGDGKISGERTHFGKFMTGVTRKKNG